MNNHKKSMFTISLSVLPLLMFASIVEAGPNYICHHHDETREIEVVYDQIGQTVPCQVVYRKAEGEQVLWSAQAEDGYCEEKASAFAAKQEGWGWTCSLNTADLDEAASQEDPINADNFDQFQLEETAESVEEEVVDAAEDIEEAAEEAAEEATEVIDDAATDAEDALDSRD